MSRPLRPQDRREHPRIEHELPIKVAANGYDFVTYTQNISCLGTYCHINKYVPPFTRVQIKLSLPIATSKGSKTSAVECKGVIVRSEDATKGGFNIAVFFNAINDEQRRVISQYINQFLPQESLALGRPESRWAK